MKRYCVLRERVPVLPATRLLRALCVAGALSAPWLAPGSVRAQAPDASDWGYYGGDAL